jgi:S-DNA-T family DNA segregation ATPase FtsK/SpoIIIE
MIIGYPGKCSVNLPADFPLGVTAAELLTSAKVELLAGNLGRHRHEVWPQREKDTDARLLDLWVADKGTMDKPAPPWPLLHDGEVDVFRDRLPWGVTMRAEQITVGMLQKHWLIGATSKQGKSTVLRLLALGLALDPTVELHIADLKGDGDWSMFAPRAATLIEGSADEHAQATTEMLEWAVGEVARRYDAKRAAGIVGAIPREVSRRKSSGFHPIYLFVDECRCSTAHRTPSAAPRTTPAPGELPRSCTTKPARSTSTYSKPPNDPTTAPCPPESAKAPTCAARSTCPTTRPRR